MTLLNNKKAFVSIFTIFFITVILFYISNDKEESINDFIIIEQAKIQKQNELHNLEQIIINSLSQPGDNPEIIKEITNNKIYNYTSNKEFYVYNKVTTKKEKLSINKLNSLSRVIVYKPNNLVVIKKYILTNGILQNQSISLEIKTRNYQTREIFPNNYEVSLIAKS